ncbi:uncharacterized protein KY384_003774 [Bacidia gigantensis]|uniref:uncharacterized protein n=1 Tax=Bacidia gigantensis TaxID=2732470 RepID=UPI001D03CEC1|nr:uncharacterized protein KY384_003774 [Bacidia gigantensis]KAG8532135.1 hypothetical protein KY384_003774 [Bacidia gigantensis]
MVDAIRYNSPALPIAFTFYTLPWVSLEQQLSIHLEPAEPGDEAKLAWSFGLHGAISAVGADGFFSLGHIWYFFSDVYPSLHNGQRPLDPPQFWRNLFERVPADTGAQPINNEIAAATAPELR